MKIGILTHYYHNHNIGALLQAYSLSFLLQKQGNRIEQIAFDFKQAIADIQFQKKKNFKSRLIELFTHPELIVFKMRILLIKPFLKKQIAIFLEFEHFIPHSSRQYNNGNIYQVNNDYDVFIIGSDQVFASYLLPLNAYYGEFATLGKKVISYAASSDKEQFPLNAEKLFIQKLQRLNAISVREKTLKDYIERITPYKATVVLDPTFLLSPQEWLKIANQKVVPQKPYIFCYFLGEKSAWQRKTAQVYADKYGYEVIHLPYIMRTVRPADKYLKGQGRYDVGPREFISLINKAKCVFTDSFHGLAFSINFGKNFYVFNRDDASGPRSMNARITDTLKIFGLQKRHITDKNAKLDNKPIDFTSAHKILEKEKQNSINWLLNALKD